MNLMQLLDELWAIEAESRIDAFEKGSLKSMTKDDFFNEREK